MPLPHPKRLAQHRDGPGYIHPSDKSHAPLGQRQLPRRRHETRGQLLQPQTTAVLPRGLASQLRVDVLRVDRLLQSRNSRRRSPGRWKCRWNNGSWNQPLKFSTLPLNWGSRSGINTGLTP